MTTDHPGASQLALKVSPNAGRNELAGLAEGVLQVKIAAPPDKGRANRELVDFLSRQLGVSRTSITIVRGLTGRHKAITVAGLGREEILRRLGF